MWEAPSAERQQGAARWARADSPSPARERKESVCELAEHAVDIALPFAVEELELALGRRLVRLGAQLCAQDGALLNRDFARAWLPQTLGPGDLADVPIEIPAPEQPGRYTLKFDLVSEGIDWFERCGSPTTSRTLWVR